MDSSSLLKALMGPVEVLIQLSLGVWLSHGQSCRISYFYISRYISQKLQFVIDFSQKSKIPDGRIFSQSIQDHKKEVEYRFCSV